jgi:hypothetical protein
MLPVLSVALRARIPPLWVALDRRLSRLGGPAITCVSLRRVLVQEQRPGVVDGVALLWRGNRVEPVAMRLDGATGRWQLTELQYIHPDDRLRRAQVGA